MFQSTLQHCRRNDGSCYVESREGWTEREQRLIRKLRLRLVTFCLCLFTLSLALIKGYLAIVSGFSDGDYGEAGRGVWYFILGLVAVKFNAVVQSYLKQPTQVKQLPADSIRPPQQKQQQQNQKQQQNQNHPPQHHTQHGNHQNRNHQHQRGDQRNGDRQFEHSNMR